ncbi:MAG: BamA/TamA family outer membrane protein [Bacteroidales bacterium]|nr:BamA/TamA family outer membrane protein [Bacteroidales bacterium]
MTTESFAQKKDKPLIDTLDNALDLSYYLYNLRGFLPVISPITEPAVGYGATFAGLFFIPKKDVEKEKFQMPDIVGVAGGLTENGTWFGGGGYFGFWKKDHIRYRGVLGYGEINLKYYGKGDNILEKYPAKFTIESYFLLQQAIFRLGESKFLMGGKYQFGKATITFFEDSELPFVDPKDFELTNSGLGLISEYENFNNILSPSKGLRVNLTYDQYLQGLGSDLDFGRFILFSHYYLPVNKFWTAGFRVESQLATGKTPFYMMPYIDLRGIPIMRYQGELTALVETEQEVSFTKRWSIVGFAGIGTTYNSIEDMDRGSTAWNAGSGFRYLIARLLGLKMGVDVARGPEDWAFYVVVGSSWMK